MLNRKVICALDTSDLEEALTTTRKLAPYIGAFKVGHALTLPHGLDVLDRLREAGAKRVFLDLKFHDIPNSVALAVREAAKRGVWMMTMHISGGEAMMSAAVEQAHAYSAETAPLLLGVSVLTSLDERMLKEELGVSRGIEDQMTHLSKLAIGCGLDGVVCSAAEIKPIRAAIGTRGVIVTPGIRLPQGETHDQARVGTASQAVTDGADYLVVGRAITQAADIEATIRALGVETAGVG